MVTETYTTGASTAAGPTAVDGKQRRPIGGDESPVDLTDTIPHEDAMHSGALRSKKFLERKYKHVFAIHSQPKTSCLSHESMETPSFIGFRNLMVLVLIVGNLRLVIENYMKYGFIISLQNDMRWEDIRMGVYLYLLIPVHLLIAYLIELVAAAQARSAHERRKKMRSRQNCGQRGFSSH